MNFHNEMSSREKLVFFAVSYLSFVVYLIYIYVTLLTIADGIERAFDILTGSYIHSCS